MAPLHLKTSVGNGDDYYLFDSEGKPIELPPEEKWNWTYGPDDTFCLYPDKELNLDLPHGQYWLVTGGNNVTLVHSVLVGEEIKHEGIGCVVTDPPKAWLGSQLADIEGDEVAKKVPPAVFESFLGAARITLDQKAA